MADATRTPEELSNPDYNYFLFLRIGALDKIKDADIEKEIKKKLGATSGDLVVRRMIELRKDIENVMLHDPAARQREADAARKFKLDEMTALVGEMGRNKGKLFVSELQSICATANQSGQYITFDELMKACEYLKTAGVQIIDNTKGKIRFSDFEKAGKLLEAPPAYRDLYDFLGLAAGASVQDITAKKTEKYNEVQKSSDLKVKQRGSNLCGICEVVLIKDAETRRQYDYYIQVKESVWDTFAMRKRFGTKSISMEEYLNYANILKSTLKLGTSDVEEMLGDGMRYYGLTLTGGDTNSLDLARCPYPGCGKFYKRGAKVCPHCGGALEVVCWNCGSRMPFTEESKSCPTCGAAFQSKAQAEQKAAELSRLLSAPVCDLIAIKTALVALQNIVPGNNAAKAPNSFISKKVKECNDFVTRREQEEKTLSADYNAALSKLREQIGKKNFMTAEGMAAALKTKFPTYNRAQTDKAAQEVAAAMQAARARLSEARAAFARGDINGGIAKATAALDACADFRDVTVLMQKYPPATPKAPKVNTVHNKTVRLEWAPGDNAMVSYTVVRKIGSAPRDESDGDELIRGLSLCFYEDESLTSPAPYHYAVFATRCGITSAPLAFPPVQIFFDVTDLHQEVVPGKISVKWTVPHNVKSVEVWRKSGTIAPTQPGDGTRVAVADNAGFEDAVRGENSYLILCNYEVGGKAYRSRGVCAVFKPFEIPVPAAGLSLDRTDACDFRLRGNLPSGAAVRLLTSREKLSVRPGAVQKMSDYNTLCRGCGELRPAYESDGSVTFTAPADTLAWLYVLTGNDQLFVLSEPLLLNAVRGLSDVYYEEQEGQITVCGKLPADTRHVIAMVDYTAFPTSLDGAGEKLTISADDFRQNGGFRIRLKANAAHYITLFAELAKNGKTVYSMGTSLDEPILQTPRVTVQYSLTYTPNPGKSFKLTADFGADGELELPRLLLVKGRPRPMTKSEGTLAETIEGVRLKKGLFSSRYRARVTLTLPPDSPMMKFRLFVADDKRQSVQLKEVTQVT